MTIDNDKHNVKLSAVSCKHQPTTCRCVDDDHAIIDTSEEQQ